MSGILYSDISKTEKLLEMSLIETRRWRVRHKKYGKSVYYKKAAQDKGAEYDHQYFISR